MKRIAARRVSVKDVARVAGVSTQTVSRVVNESDSVTPATRDKVRKVIAQLGYRRNELARNLIQGRSRMLGVVFAGRDYLGGSNLNSGITAEAEAQGYALLLKERHPNDASSPQQFIESLLDRQVDGVLWMLSDREGQHVPLLQEFTREHGVPVVALVRSNSVGVPFSAFDNFGAGVMATRHLIAGGCKRIAHITGPLSSWDAQERARGWRVTLEEAGMPPDDVLMCVGDWSPESGDAGLRRLLARAPDIDAVFAANDRTAMGAMLAAHRLGKSIPRDISVVGVDGVYGSDWLHPPLTTVRQNQVEMGRQAVRMLSRLVEARFSGKPTPVLPDYLHPPELIIRESSR